VSAYLNVLGIADFRRLWIGLTLNLLGDGASFTAMAWVTVNEAGTRGLGFLGVCYTLPVLAGGLVVGPLLDRFSRRCLLIADSVVRGFVVAAVPLLHALGVLAPWHLYVVATVYGLMKIIPLAAVPTVVPELVSPNQLQAASGLEAVALGAAGVAGPALGAVAITAIGAPSALVLDAATYWLFALLIAQIETRLAPPDRAPDAATDRGGWAPVVWLVLRDRSLLFIVLSFMAFNVSTGVLLVALPWLAKFRFDAGPSVLGLLLAMAAGAELAGSLVSGAVKTSERQMFRIGVLQFLSGAAYLLVLGPNLYVIVAGLLVNGVLAGPMTVLSGVVRLTRIPNQLRGRTMTLTRTLMSGALPVGSAIAATMLAAGLYSLLIFAVGLLAAGPGLLTAITFRTTSLTERLEPDNERTPVLDGTQA
jgi:MFS family permease